MKAADQTNFFHSSQDYICFTVDMEEFGKNLFCNTSSSGFKGVGQGGHSPSAPTLGNQKG